MNRTSRAKRITTGSVLVVASLVLAACGGSPTAGEAATPTAVESSAAPAGAETAGNTLADGPPSPGEDGPLSASDANKDGTVTRAEIEAFMDAGPERRIGLVAFFDQNDANGDKVVDTDELAAVEPAYAFDGTDANDDGEVSRAEVQDYVDQPGRVYRTMGLGEFFDLVDTNSNDKLSPAEIEAAHVSGLLERG